MQFLILFLLLIFFILIFPCCRRSNGESSSSTKKYETFLDGKNMTKQEILEKLSLLEKTNAPEKLSIGAMCYKVAGPPDRVEYICPVCGEKTLYSSSQNKTNKIKEIDTIDSILPFWRKNISTLEKFNIKLDESQFCSKCSPEIKEPKLGIVVRYTDDSEPVKIYDISIDDYSLLYEFFNNKTIHKGDRDSETPLKDHQKRISELLGIKAVLNILPFSKEDLKARLRKLKDSPTPEKLNFGAMCYDMAASPNRIEYVCPACGEKTLYANETNPDLFNQSSSIHTLLFDLQHIRNKKETMKKWNILIDESQFCKNCSPNIKTPELGIVFQYSDESRQLKKFGITAEDIDILIEFFENKLIHKGEQDREAPLKNFAETIEEILNLKK